MHGVSMVRMGLSAGTKVAARRGEIAADGSATARMAAAVLLGAAALAPEVAAPALLPAEGSRVWPAVSPRSSGTSGTNALSARREPTRDVTCDEVSDVSWLKEASCAACESTVRRRGRLLCA